MIKKLSQMEATSTHKKNLVSFLCGYLGIGRQGYYRHVDRTLETDVLRTSIVLYCQAVLHEMPKAGMRQLYELSRRKFGKKFTIGLTSASSCSGPTVCANVGGSVLGRRTPITT
ncbi:MAG: hypothetical protein SOY49_01370 [Prevotella sp.]|nr:hypothetical protein [Prevotella sp.]